MIKLIASDLDGTMFEKGNIIPETNLKAIDDINNSNINFTICTGKTYSLFKNICQDIETGYGIFGNGNQIINLKNGEEIYRKLLKNEDVLFCINTAKKLKLHVHLYTNKEVITEKLLYMDLRNFELTKNDKNIDLEFKIVTDILNLFLAIDGFSLAAKDCGKVKGIDKIRQKTYKDLFIF